MINQTDAYVAIIISSVGCFCFGFILGSFRESFWMFEWLKIEIDLARAQKRELRKVKDVEKGIWKP